MKKQQTIIAVLLITVFIFAFDKPQDEPHIYTYKGSLGQFIYTNNFLSKVQETLRKSNLPANEVFATNDTIEMLKNLYMSQINQQYLEFRKLDSIAESKKKK